MKITKPILLFMLFIALCMTAFGCFTDKDEDKEYTIKGTLYQDKTYYIDDQLLDGAFSKLVFYTQKGKRVQEVKTDFFGTFSVKLKSGTYYLNTFSFNNYIPSRSVFIVTSKGRVISSDSIVTDKPASVETQRTWQETSGTDKYFYENTYDKANVLTEKVYFGTSNSGTLTHDNVYTYDEKGVLIGYSETTINITNMAKTSIYYEYTYDGALLTQVKAYNGIANTAPLVSTITFTYDAENLVTQFAYVHSTTTSLNRTVTYAYQNGNITSVKRSTSYPRSYTYDENNNVTTYTIIYPVTQASLTYEYIYTDNALTTIKRYAGTSVAAGTLNETTTVTYDAQKNIATIVSDFVSGTDSCQGYAYNASNFVTSYMYYTGSIECSGTVETRETYAYNTDNLMTKSTYYMKMYTGYDDGSSEFTYDDNKQLSTYKSYNGEEPSAGNLSSTTTYTWQAVK